MAEAEKAAVADPTRMALATVDAEGRPSVRMVLLKGCDERGFVFYTNLTSPKAQHLAARPWAELCFHWPEIDRQVRVAGPVTAVTPEEADAYFASRARLSQIGAWASRQSQTMDGYWELEKAVAKKTLQFGLGAVPRPPFWSGYRVAPEWVEFWHQKPFRHHERYRLTRTDKGWVRAWLFP